MYLSWPGLLRFRDIRNKRFLYSAPQLLNIFELKEPVVIDRMSILGELARCAPGTHRVGGNGKQLRRLTHRQKSRFAFRLQKSHPRNLNRFAYTANLTNLSIGFLGGAETKDGRAVGVNHYQLSARGENC